MRLRRSDFSGPGIRRRRQGRGWIYIYGDGERVTDPGEIKAAIRRGIEQTQNGRPALLEFITQKEVQTSDY